MKPVVFVVVTLFLAALRLRIGQGSPDFLAVWLVVVAFYGEGSRGAAQAGWIGLLHGFPSHSRVEAVLALGVYLVLHAQRFHLGRDGWLPRTLVTAIVSLALCLPGLWPLGLSVWDNHTRLLVTFALVTGLLSWPLFAIGRRWGHTLALRPLA